MTSKASSNGKGLISLPNAKEAISYGQRLINQPVSSVIDLDSPSNIQILPSGDLGIWLDSWHLLVDALGTQENALEGVEKARDILFLASCRLRNLLFSADSKKPPLDQFGKGMRLLFQSSTCYDSVLPVATYKGRVVYWGSSPAFKGNSEALTWSDVRYMRPARAGGL